MKPSHRHAPKPAGSAGGTGAPARGERADDGWGDWADFADFDVWDAASGDPAPGSNANGPTGHGAPAVPEAGQSAEDEGRLVRFARDYGWRAYAIPVLAVITVFVLISMVQNPTDTVVDTAATQDRAEEHSESSAPAGDDKGSELEPANLPVWELDEKTLPPGGPYAENGEKTFYEVGSPGASTGTGSDLVVRYVVEVEHGVDTNGYGGDDAFSKMVDATLMDPRGWSNDPRFRFEHVTEANNPTLHIRLASVGTTKEMCGADIGMETSCRTRITGEDAVVVNESRWVRGAVPYEGDIGRYRQYLINHEVGHAVGFAEHEGCPADGELAPIMMQQTLSLNNAELRSFGGGGVYPDNRDTCRSNPWPYPRPAVL